MMGLIDWLLSLFKVTSDAKANASGQEIDANSSSASHQEDNVERSEQTKREDSQDDNQPPDTLYPMW